MRLKRVSQKASQFERLLAIGAMRKTWLSRNVGRSGIYNYWLVKLQYKGISQRL